MRCLCPSWLAPGSAFRRPPSRISLRQGRPRPCREARTRACQCFGYFVNLWSKHLRASLGLLRRSFAMAQETGDLRYAVYSLDRLVTILLAVGDPLDDVQREAERGLEFARKAKFGFVVDIITGQLKLIQTLRGLTPSFCSFNDEGFDEVGFEHYLEADPQLIF